MNNRREIPKKLERLPVIAPEQAISPQAGVIFESSPVASAGAEPDGATDVSETASAPAAGNVSAQPGNELTYPYLTVTGRVVTAPRRKRSEKKRQQLLRMGARVKEMSSGIRERENGSLHEIFSDVSTIAKPLTQRTFSADQVHRRHAPFVARAMQESRFREEVIREIDEVVSDRSVQLGTEIRRGGYYVPAVVVGSGFTEMILSTEFSRRLPQGSLMSIDRANHLGGQFRNNGGRRPTFGINSRTRPEDRRFPKLPGEDGNIISLGENAPLQLPDFANGTFPTNLDLGDAIAVNQFLAGQDYLLGVSVAEWKRNRNQAAGAYRIFLRDGASDQGFSLSTDALIFASGIGDPRPGVDLRDAETRSIFDESQQRLKEGASFAPVMFVEQLLAHFSNEKNRYPMQPFIGKTIGILGDGDGGKIAASLFARVAPPEAYGYSSIQLGGPAGLRWFGINCVTQEEYAESARSRYLNLKSFFPRELGGEAFIQPFRQKATGMSRSGSGGIVLNGQTVGRIVDVVIIAAGYERNTPVFGNAQYDVVYKEDKDGSVIPAYRQISGENVYQVGACAQLPLVEAEKPINSVEVSENSVSTWLTGRRTKLASGFIGRDIRGILKRRR